MKKDIKILVVDDEEIMRNLFTDILQEEGYKVTTVHNGKEAQEKIKQGPFDIVFVDVHMPVMDGLKTLYMLREATPNTAIVMMDSMPQYVLEEFQKQGAVTCIHKPFDIRGVRKVVHEILKKGGADG